MDSTLQGRGRLIPNFQNALQQGLAIPVEGDGSQSRTFTWIEDVTEGLVQLMQHRCVLDNFRNWPRSLWKCLRAFPLYVKTTGAGRGPGTGRAPLNYIAWAGCGFKGLTV